MTYTKTLSHQIKKLDVALPWLAALEFAKEAGGLPTNIQFEHAISDNNKPFNFDERSWWTSSIIAYPESGNVFIKGKDIIDSIPKDRVWVLPASCLPGEVFESQDKRICILMDYYNITVTGSKVVIEPTPGTMRILSGFIQKSGKSGVKDPETGIPLVPNAEKNFETGNVKTAINCNIYRSNCQRVIPISRGPWKESVNADLGATDPLNVSSINFGLDDELQNLHLRLSRLKRVR